MKVISLCGLAEQRPKPHSERKKNGFLCVVAASDAARTLCLRIFTALHENVWTCFENIKIRKRCVVFKNILNK